MQPSFMLFTVKMELAKAFEMMGPDRSGSRRGGRENCGKMGGEWVRLHYEFAWGRREKRGPRSA